MITDTVDRRYKIGEVAELVGVTTRTIRYYEELGLVGTTAERSKGAHRLFTGEDVSRLKELIRLRDLLGLSLDELVELAEAESARAGLRDEWADSVTDEQRARIVEVALPLVERQLALVRTRQRTLDEFAGELADKLKTLRRMRKKLAPASPDRR